MRLKFWRKKKDPNAVRQPRIPITQKKIAEKGIKVSQEEQRIHTGIVEKPHVTEFSDKELKNIKIGSPRTNQLKETYSDFYKDIEKRKTEILELVREGKKSVLTKEDIDKEILKHFQQKKAEGNTIFDTRPDKNFVFYTDRYKLLNRNMPIEALEQITIGGRVFYHKKKFINNRLIVEKCFPAPELSYDLNEEAKKITQTKRKVKKLEGFLNQIENEKNAEGGEKWDIIDLIDIKDELYDLQLRLQSVKFGKIAFMEIEEVNLRTTCFMMMQVNFGEFRYLKGTENQFVTTENSVRQQMMAETIRSIEEYCNLSIKKDWSKTILWILIFIGVCIFFYAMYQIINLEHAQTIVNAKLMCGEQQEFFTEFIKKVKTACNVDLISLAQDTPGFKTQGDKVPTG